MLARLRFLETHGRRRLAGQIDHCKTGGIQTTHCAVLMVGQLETAVARAQRDRAAPGERDVSAFDQTAIGVDRFRITVKPVWIAAYVRPYTLAGLDAIPATGDDGSHLDDAERS